MNGAQTHLLNIQAQRQALVNKNGKNNAKAQKRFYREGASNLRGWKCNLVLIIFSNPY